MKIKKDPAVPSGAAGQVAEAIAPCEGAQERSPDWPGPEVEKVDHAMMEELSILVMIVFGVLLVGAGAIIVMIT